MTKDAHIEYLETKVDALTEELHSAKEEIERLKTQITCLQTYGCKGTNPDYPPSYYDDDRC